LYRDDKRAKSDNGVKCMVKYLGLHETLDVHEILTLKNLSLTKTSTMSKLAQDPELKAILEQDAHTCSQHIKQLQQFLTKREELQ
jgi:similar to spore coat protein